MSTKKYKLLKDLPDAKAGTILTSDGNDSYDYKSHRTGNDNDHALSWYKGDLVENSPEWFEEFEEEKIDWEQEVEKCKQSPYYFATKYLTKNGIPFTTTLTEDKFNECFGVLLLGKGEPERTKQQSVPEKTFTQEQLNEERRRAFNAGRSMYKVQIPNNGKQYGDLEFNHTTFEDYLKSIQ